MKRVISALALAFVLGSCAGHYHTIIVNPVDNHEQTGSGPTLSASQQTKCWYLTLQDETTGVHDRIHNHPLGIFCKKVK